METNQWTNEFNPFNWMKFFAHVYRWKEVGKTPPPAPVQAGIDPSNVCQLNCDWCNSSWIRNDNPAMMDKETLLEIADYLPHFTDHPVYGGVEAACIAGGGEPLTNPATQVFLDRLRENGIKPGLITNGILLHRFDLGNCEWAGVSVDSGTRETYNRLKKGDHFDKVIKNLRSLVKTEGIVSKPGKGHGISYKFIMYPGNVDDISQAAELAKDTGCRNIHIRPYAPAFKGVGKSPEDFTQDDITRFRNQLDQARRLEDKDFAVYGVTHKFDGSFKGSNDFENCYAILFAISFEPPTVKGKGFNTTFCCDRRGDKLLTLENTSTAELKEYWGSKEHLALVDKIDPQKCGRCIRGPHNRIFENAVVKEDMSYEFG